MKFFVDIDVVGLPTTRYSVSAANDFKQLSKEEGDLLLANSHTNYPRSICFRDGRDFSGLADQTGPGDICTLVFDDFQPGMTLNDQPPWYGLLKKRVVAVRAEENYGPGQRLPTVETITYRSATARIRHQQARWGNAGVLVHVVKIIAKGTDALDDARHLHTDILNGSI